MLIGICILLLVQVPLCAQFRLVISSDFPPVDVIPGGAGHGEPHQRSDPDDVQSIVRLLVYANEFTLEGLIAAAGTLANRANKQHLLDVIDVYDQVDEQLRLHDRRYPAADALRQITRQGLSGTYGQPAEQILGEGKDSEASQFIIQLIDAPDPTPVWFCFWGGTQEMAQALWRVKSTRTPEQVQQFIAKLRLYFIDHQDGTAQWLKDEFPGLFIVDNRKSYKGMFYNAPGADTTLADAAWLERHVRTGRGPLGALYPPTGWDPAGKGVIEGDTPSFLYLYSQIAGLSDPEKPDMGSWGGRFVRINEQTRHWEDAPENTGSITRWQADFQADFAARMERCVRSPQEVNSRPEVILNGDTTRQVLYLKARPGQTVALNTDGSADPDGHALSYHWFTYPEAGTYPGEIQLNGNRKPRVRIRVPNNRQTGTFHVIVAVTDKGSPALTSYRRVVIEVQ
jgi:hypothetical protein